MAVFELVEGRVDEPGDQRGGGRGTQFGQLDALSVREDDEVDQGLDAAAALAARVVGVDSGAERAALTSGPAWAAAFLAASLMARSSERQSPYPSVCSATAPYFRSDAGELEEVVGERAPSDLSAVGNDGEVVDETRWRDELVGAYGVSDRIGNERGIGADLDQVRDGSLDGQCR